MSSDHISITPHRMSAWTEITQTDWIPPLGEELEKHIQEYKGQVRFASCSAWGLLYRLMEQHDAGDRTVVFEEGGKPVFLEQGLYFSISHSRNICAAALSDQPIGIDVELCRDKYRDGLLERTLSEAEMEIFDGDFTRIWCRKEAAAKMTGEGIWGYPKKINTLDKNLSFQEEMIPYAGQAYWLVSVIQKKAGI